MHLSFASAPSSPPVNLSIAAKGLTYVLLNWLPPPIEDHNGNIRFYKVNLEESLNPGMGQNLTTDGQQPSLLLDTLEQNTNYSCSVAAVTVSVGPSSERIYFTTEIQRMYFNIYNYV